jgi:hypothetical protein
VASLDKIKDGPGSPQYKIFLPAFEKYWAIFETNPKNFVLTFEILKKMSILFLSILYDSVSFHYVLLGLAAFNLIITTHLCIQDLKSA